MKNNKGFTPILIVLIIIGVLALGGGTYYFLVKKTQKPVGCTQEAKICPDGSAVGRTGPNCEFAECPTANADETANWKTYTNTKYGYEIKYPNDWNSPIESGDSDALTGNYSGFFKRENILIAFSINVYENDKNLSLKEWWEQEFYDKFTVKYEYSYEGVVSVSSGIEAAKYKIQRMGFEDNCYLISRDQRVYTIYFSVLPGEEEIQQILSTFRFLE